MKNIFAIAFSILFSQIVLASDHGGKSLAPAIESALESADKVFIGTVVPLPNNNSQVAFYVKEWFKGKTDKKVVISCERIKEGCDSDTFNTGISYLVYASKAESSDVYHVYKDTSLTKAFHLADLDVELLRDMDHPFYWNDDSAWWFDE